MKLLENKINSLIREDLKNFIIFKENFTFNDIRDGYLYITTKKYINKLFKDTNFTYIFINKNNDSGIVTKESNIEWCKKLSEWLDEKNFEEIAFKFFDNYYWQDEYIIKSPNETCFALYFNLLEEYITVYSLNTFDNALKIFYEGKYLFDEDGLEDIKLLLNSKIDLSAMFNEEIELSVSEYIEVLNLLSFVKKKRKSNWVLTKEGDNCNLLGIVPMISSTVDEINELNWLMAHIKSSRITFNDICKILTYKFNDIKISDFYYLYEKNLNETLDQDLIKQGDYYGKDTIQK